MIRKRAHAPLRRRAQHGYAFLLVVLFTTVLLISTMAVSSSILTNGRREKEEEMVWRGNQYVRGIKLYYRKLGRFPTTVDDLTKAQVGNLHFMRQAFKDPMNKEDGSWRLLYVGPNGQLLGSLKPQQPNLQMPGAQGIGTPVSTIAGAPPQAGAFGGNPQTGTAPGAQPGMPPVSPTGTAPTGASGTDAPNGQNDPMLSPPADSGSSSSIIGGNIIGVASKVNERSLRIYEKAKNYKLFEFYWDPSKDAAAATQNGMQPGKVPGAAPIGTPVGQPGTTGPGGTGNPQNPGGVVQPPLQGPPPNSQP